MQCACAILTSAACPGPTNFLTLFHKLNDFRKEVFEHKNVFCDILYNFCLEKLFSLRITELMINNV